MRTISLILILLAGLPASAAAATCPGVGLALQNVHVSNVASTNSVNTYTLTGTVTNLGSVKQASDALVFVDISYGTQRVNNRGIPPLAPGQSYSFSYDWPRASDAGNGSTTLDFRLRFVSPTTPQLCGGAGDVKVAF